MLYKTSKTILSIISFLVVLPAGLLILSNITAYEGRATSSLEDVKLTLFMPDGDSAYLLHIIAQEKGYFTEAGINLMFQQGTGEDRELPPESDLYLMGRSRVYEIEAAHPGLIKAFNFNTQDESRWNDAILVKKNLDITSLSQLEKGSSIGLIGGGPARFPLIKIMLKKNNLNPEDFKLISLDDASKIKLTDDVIYRTALINDFVSKVNIVYAREPFVSLLLARKDWKIMIDEPLFARNIFSPWPMSMTLFSTKFLKEKPALAQKVISVYDKAISFIRENPQQAQSILSKYIEKKYGINGLKMRLVNYLKSGEIAKEVIQRQSDWYAKNGLTKGKIHAENLIIDGKTFFAKTPQRQQTDKTGREE